MDANHEYGSEQTAWLLERYIPAKQRMRDGLELRTCNFYGGKDEDLSEDARLLARYLADDMSANRLLVKLSVRSPTGRMTSSGMTGMHAVALCIDHAARSIDYQDPYGFPMDTILQQQLSEVLHGYTLRDHQISQQKDLYSCAPITIRNLMRFAMDQMPEPDIDIAAIRAQDADTLKAMPKPSPISGRKLTFKIRN